MPSENFNQWLEDHRPHAWGITIASEGEQVGVVAECYDCNTIEEFGVIDPYDVIMRHWSEQHGGGEGSSNREARA